MNYYKNYIDYIAYVKTKNRKKLNKKDKEYVYYENHHIIPRCMGGNNDDKNLVLLTAREHFLAHYLLVKIYKNTEYYGKLSLAFFQFTYRKNKNGQQSRIYNSKLYDYCRKNLDLSLSEDRKNKISETRKKHEIGLGEKNPFYGRKHSQETIQKMKKSQHKRVNSENYINPWSKPRTQKEKEFLSKLKKGTKLSKNTKNNIKLGIQNSKFLDNMRTANKGKHWYTNGNTNVFLKESEQVPEGYYLGRVILSERHSSNN